MKGEPQKKQKGISMTTIEKNAVKSDISDVNNKITDEQVAKLISQLVNKTENKKETKTIEYRYIHREISPGHFYHWDFRQEGGFLFRWNDEYWKVQSEKTTKEEIELWLKTNHLDRYTPKTVESIYKMLMITIKEFEPFNDNEIIIPTKKHWLKVDPKTGDITAIVPTKDKPIRHQINMVVEKAGPFLLPAKEKPFPPKKDRYFHNFIETSLGTGSKKMLVQEYCGYTFTNTTRKQKMQMWIGDGANGKSVMLHILSSAHGAAISVDISDVHRYNNHLVGTSLIYATETDKKGFKQEFVKQAVSGDTIELRGIFSKKQNAKLIAKWIISMNNKPLISDFSQGLFRRIHLIEWNNQFTGENGNAKPIEDLEKLIVANEMDDFIIWCLQGLQRMIKANWTFTESDEVKTAIENWKVDADKVRMFVKDNNYHYSTDKKEYTSKKKIFDFFNQWSEDNGFEQMNSTTFWLRMSNIFPELKKDPEKKINGERVAYVKAKPQLQ